MYAVCFADRCEHHPSRDFGLYLDARWAPTWPAVVLDWPDFGLPANERDAVAQIRDAFQRAQDGQHVEVGCLGGLGRTGTVVACMAILAGERPEEAVKWVRTNYDAGAVETNKQEAWVMTFSNWERVWCYYQNLVHTVYREVRHIGEPGDKEAKYQVPDQYLLAAQQCQQHRQTLKSSVPFRNAKGVKTDDVIYCYETLTGLTLEDLLVIFSAPGWMTSYGGEKWAKITEVLLHLKREIDRGALEATLEICKEVRQVRHNSGPLVPSMQEWKKSAWVQEKWPILCESGS